MKEMLEERVVQIAPFRVKQQWQHNQVSEEESENYLILQSRCTLDLYNLKYIFGLFKL